MISLIGYWLVETGLHEIFLDVIKALDLLLFWWMP